MSRATRQWILVFALFAGSVGALTACNLVLGNLQDAVGDGGRETSTGSSSGSEGSGDSSTGSSSGSEGSGDSSTGSSSRPDGGGDSATGSSSGSEGGAVATSLCGDSGACVLGGVFSVGEGTGNAGSAILSDGGTITLMDNGFEFGGTSCDTTGTKCVTGAITP
jgi:hypothetical protein